MSDSVYIALDLGGTKLMAAAIASDRTILARERAPTPRSFKEGIELVKRLAGAVSAGRTVVSIGASAGGPLDHVSGVVSPLHYPEWRDVPLKRIFEEEFGVPFTVDVDTNAGALAEYHYGGHRVDRLLYLTLSTGLGGGFVVDGEIYRGAGGSHPEIGHQAVPYELPVSGPIECPCGATDCLEAVVSGTAIRKIYGKPAEELGTAEWDQIASNLGQGVRNVAAVYAPAAVVIGGGMALGGGARLVGGVRAVLERSLKIVPVPQVALSTLGYDSALWGAFALAEGGSSGQDCAS